MGRFVNPGNRAFAVALRSEIYIDKTGLIEYTNRVLDTKQALICNSSRAVSENQRRLICLQHIIAGDAIQGKCFPDYPLAGRKVFRGI